MSSVKVKFRPSSIAGIEGTVYYQIIHARKTRQLATEYKIFPSEWNERRCTLLVPQNSHRTSFVQSIRERIRWDMVRLNKIAIRLESQCISYSADDIILEFMTYARKYSLFNFMESLIVALKEKGKIRTSETYRAALNSFKKYRNTEDMTFDAFTSDVVEYYEASLQKQGISPNTTSFYMRILRAVYNRAVEKDIVEQQNPFRHVYTGIDKTVKRALAIPAIKKIKILDLSFNPTLDFARDMFMLSFYMRGMSFIDMAYLRKSDLENGYVTYRRRKTGQSLIIKWTREMQLILDKYPENMTCYLLPIITSPGTNERYAYKRVAYKINHHLKKLAEIIGVSIPLTMYCARHSWASAAKAKGIPLGVISEGMGHDSEATTQIYLASLDTTAVDKANAAIIKALK